MKKSAVLYVTCVPLFCLKSRFSEDCVPLSDTARLGCMLSVLFLYIDFASRAKLRGSVAKSTANHL